MKRIEAWHTLHEMWGGATAEQKEALGIAMDDIEFVDLMRGNGVQLTNAQHIRSMTDEELATCLWQYYCDGWNDRNDWDESFTKQVLRDWLRQPYKEATDD